MKIRLATLVILLFAATAAGGGGVEGRCDVRFHVTSTLHDFTGTGRCEPFSAMLVRDAEGKSILPSVEVVVPVAEMKTGIERRDKSMRSMFRSDRYPVIRTVARNVDAGIVRERMRKDPGGETSLELFLSIRGLDRKIQASVTHWKEEGGRTFFNVSFPVSLSEFGLEPPSVLGILRVADKVVVEGVFSLDVPQGP